MNGKHARRGWAARIIVTAGAVAGALFGVGPAFGAAAHHVQAGTPALSCAVQLGVVREVSRQGSLTIGSTRTGIWEVPPWRWARELRNAGLRELARTAAAVESHTPADDHFYVMALTATADAMLANCGQRAGLAKPPWLHWRISRQQNQGYPCAAVWGYSAGVAQHNGTSALVCENGTAFTS